jgi:hypothetical protein
MRSNDQDGDEFAVPASEKQYSCDQKRFLVNALGDADGTAAIGFTTQLSVAGQRVKQYAGRNHESHYK